MQVCNGNKAAEKPIKVEHFPIRWMKYLYFLLPMPLFLLSTHKQCILSHFIHNSTAMFPKNLIPWRDSNQGLLVPEVDAMSIAPRRRPGQDGIFFSLFPSFQFREKASCPAKSFNRARCVRLSDKFCPDILNFVIKNGLWRMRTG
jgi:hypothetical protein